MTQRLRAGWAALLLISLSMALPAYADVRDNTPNSMMWGGCFTKTECIQNLQNGDGHHSAKELQSLYATQGITVSSFKSSDMVEGSVTSSGDVLVDGSTKPVASDAKSFGRQNVTGSTQVGSLYERHTSTVFQEPKLRAFVIMHNNTFQKAILMSCGNVVVAKAVPVATPKPTPKPTPTPTKTVTRTVVKPAPAPTVNVVQVQTQTQTQTQPAPAAPTPVATTTALPQTGAAAGAGLLGFSAIVCVAWYWVRSRRGLAFALRRTGL